MTTTERRYPRITDEGIAAMRARVGIPAKRDDRGKYTQINADAARGYSIATGDLNPLYVDADHARASRWGDTVAPPGILLATGEPEGRDITPEEREAGRGGALPGVHGMFAGRDFEWYAPMLAGDTIYKVTYEAGFYEKDGKFTGSRQILQMVETLFRNQRHEVVAKMLGWRMRTERDAARERKSVFRESRVWSDEELAEIDEAYARETWRGPEPRYWEDVQIGDSLGEMVRGPFRVTDGVAWEMGWGGPYARTGKSDHAFRMRHPGAYTQDPRGVWDVVERVHWDDEFAREIGVPAAYDYGAQRVGWTCNFLTNWMGDDAWLKRMWVQIRKFNILGDLQTFTGEVIDKRIEDGEYQVVCDFQAINQLNEITTPGQAIILLPSREAGNPQLPTGSQPPYPTWEGDKKVVPVGPSRFQPVSSTHGFRMVGLQD